MADVKHKVERAAFGAAIDGILKYVNKDEADREKAFLKLVDLSEKFMGDTFRKESYDAARRMIQDPDSKWMQYVNRILNEVDPHVIKMSALVSMAQMHSCLQAKASSLRSSGSRICSARTISHIPIRKKITADAALNSLSVR